jgi:hypothetical protein
MDYGFSPAVRSTLKITKLEKTGVLTHYNLCVRDTIFLNKGFIWLFKLVAGEKNCKYFCNYLKNNDFHELIYHGLHGCHG